MRATGEHKESKLLIYSATRNLQASGRCRIYPQNVAGPMSFISRFRHRHEEPMKIEGGVAYYPNRSAIRALKEVERAERGEIELEEYVPYTSKKTKRQSRWT